MLFFTNYKISIKILRAIILLLFIFLCSLFTLKSYSQIKSTKGKDFWFGFEDNRDAPGNSSIFIRAYVTADVDAHCTVTYLGKTIHFTVKAGTTHTINFPEDSLLNVSTETITKQSIHLVSDVPVSIFILNFNVDSADAAVVYPTPSLGNEYYTFCITPSDQQSSHVSQFLIIAVEDNTQVVIEPSAITWNGLPAHVPYTITLNQGDAYQVKSPYDLTGSYITITPGSTKNFVVFSGNKWAYVPSTESCCLNHLLEQMPPVTTWGKTIVSAPYLTRSADLFRVLPAEDNTNLTVNGSVVATLNKGEFYETVLGEASVFQSCKPICVMQYSRSNSTDNVGDPFMNIAYPFEQGIRHIDFYSPAGVDIKSYYLNIICKTINTYLIALDGNSINSNFQIVPSNPFYSYAQIIIDTGNHVLNSDSTYVASIYAFGGVESYGYVAGTEIDMINFSHEFNVIYNKDTILCNNFKNYVCPNDTLGFIATPDPDMQTYLWDFGDKSPTFEGRKASHFYKQPGTYNVVLRLNGTCDSVRINANIIVKQAGIKLAGPTKICKGDTTTLTLSGANTYTWSPSAGLSATTGSIVKAYPTLTTTYTIHGVVSKNCLADSSFVLNVDELKSSFLKHKSVICFGDTVNIKVNPDGIAPYKYKWTGSKDTTSILTVKNNTASLLKLVNTVTVTDGFNCRNIKHDTITLLPEVDIQLDKKDTLLCQSGSITVNASPSTGLTYQWMINGNPVPGATNKTFTDTLSGNISVVCTDNNNCKYSSPSINISFNALPKANILPSDSVNICEGKSLTLTLQTDNGIKFQWRKNGVDITDATNSTLNVNSPGDYTIVVSNSSNCKRTSDAVNVSIDPKFAKLHFYPDTTLCYGDTAHLFVTGHNGNKPYTYQWSISGAKDTVTYKNQNSTSSDLTDLITVTVTDRLGCQSEANIRVHNLARIDTNYTATPKKYPKLISDYSPYTVDFSYTGYNNDVSWDFGDNAPVNGTEATHTFIYDATKSSGDSTKYTVKMIVRNGKCTDTVKIDIYAKITLIKRIPNVFTPGKNDCNGYFRLEGIGIGKVEVSIFNRWGVKVFEKSYDFTKYNDDMLCRGLSSSSGSSNGNFDYYILWDGKDKNGREAPAGAYFYVIKPYGVQGNSLSYDEGKLNGSISLIR